MIPKFANALLVLFFIASYLKQFYAESKIKKCKINASYIGHEWLKARAHIT